MFKSPSAIRPARESGVPGSAVPSERNRRGYEWRRLIRNGSINLTYYWWDSAMKTTTQNKPTAEADLQWYEEQIQLGLDDLEAGRVLTQDEMRAAVTKELAAITARHAKSKKAA
jgi:hypothetical protein